jgi:hypothetical protein
MSDSVVECEEVAVMCLMEKHGAEKFMVLLTKSSVLTNQQYILTKLGTSFVWSGGFCR